jgi:hypothetical protein
VEIANQGADKPAARTNNVLPWNPNIAENEYAVSLMSVEYRDTNYEIAADVDCIVLSAGAGNIPGFFKANGLNFPDEGLMLRMLERRWRYASHITTIPTGFTCFIQDVAGEFGAGVLSPNKGGFPFREGIIELSYRHRELPFRAVPLKAIAKCFNCMNGAYFDPGNIANQSNNFDIHGWNIPVYGALFIGAQPEIGKLITGEMGLKWMDYRFLWAPHIVQTGPSAGVQGGWSRALTALHNIASPADYRELRTLWNNIPQGFAIPQADFSTLFRPDQV